jgi:hypothetical protein
MCVQKTGYKLCTAVSAAISDNGNVIALAHHSLNIFVSTDGGSTWTARAFNSAWKDIAMSSDGSTMIAGNGANIYVSTDTGVTWELKDTFNAQRVAISKDGTKMAAIYGASNNKIAVSTDSGSTWSMKGTSAYYLSISISGDGSLWMSAQSCMGSSNVYFSTDGTTWTKMTTSTTPTLSDYQYVDMYGNSYGCFRQAALGATKDVIAMRYYDHERLFLTTDGGQTWIPRSLNNFYQGFDYLAVSGNGGKIVAAGTYTEYPYVYTYSYTGAYGTLTTGTGTSFAITRYPWCNCDETPIQFFESSGGPAACTAYPCTQCTACTDSKEYPSGYSYFTGGPSTNQCVCPANKKLSSGSCVDCESGTYRSQYQGFTDLLSDLTCFSHTTSINDMVLMEDNAQYSDSLRNWYGSSNDDFTLAANPFWKSSDATPRYGNVKIFPQGPLILSDSDLVDLNDNVEVAFGMYAYLTPMKQNGKHYVAIIAAPSQQGTKTVSEIGAYIYSKGSNNDASLGVWTIEGSEPKLQPPNVDILHMNFGVYGRWRHAAFGFFYKHTYSGTEKGEFNLAWAGGTVNKVASASITDIDSGYVCPDFHYNTHSTAGTLTYTFYDSGSPDSSMTEADCKAFADADANRFWNGVLDSALEPSFPSGCFGMAGENYIYYSKATNNVACSSSGKCIKKTGEPGSWKYRVVCRKKIDDDNYEIKLYQQNDGSSSYTSSTVTINKMLRMRDPYIESDIYIHRAVALDSNTLYYIGGDAGSGLHVYVNKVYKRSINSDGTIGSTETEIKDVGSKAIAEIKAHPHTDGYLAITLTGSSRYYLNEFHLMDSSGTVLKTLSIPGHPIEVMEDYPYWIKSSKTDAFKKMHEIPGHQNGRLYLKGTHYNGDSLSTFLDYDHSNTNQRSLISFGLKNVYLNVKAQLGNRDTLRHVVKVEHPFGCPENFYGNNGECTICPTGKVRSKGDDPECTDCACDFPRCEENFFGNNGVCTACPTGYTNPPGDYESCTTCGCDPPVSTSGNSTVTTPTFELDALTLTADATIVGNGATITTKTGSRTFSVGSNKLVISNVTIVGGNVYTTSSRRRLLADSCDTPGATNAKACMGGVAHADGGTMEFTDVVLKGGNAKYGGCLYGQNGATIILTRTVVVNCTIDDAASGTFSETTDTLVGGAGIYLRGSSSTLTIINSDLKTNACGDQTNWGNYCSGGALHLADGASGTITGGSMNSNKGHLGGALYLSESGHLVVSGTTIELNDASFAGGAVVAWKSKLTLKDGTKLLKNEGEYFGGCIYYVSDSTSNYLKIIGSVVKDNKLASPQASSSYLGGAITSGGWVAVPGINFRKGLIEIRESTFCNNKNGATISKYDGDHIFYLDDDELGGTNSVRRPTVIIVNSEFKGSVKNFGAMVTVPTSASCSSSPCSATGFTGSCTDLTDNLGTKCECSTGTLEPSFMGSESCCGTGCAGVGHCVLCDANDKVSGGVCVDCEANKYSLGGADVTEGDSTCAASCQDAPNDADCLNVCAENNYVHEYSTTPSGCEYDSSSGKCYKCEACASGFTNEGGDNPKMYVKTACKPATQADCAINQYVLYHECTTCPTGKHNPNGASLNNYMENDAAFNLCCDYGLYPNADGSACEAKQCAENERVDANGFCVACSGGNRDAGDFTNAGETQCYPTPATTASSNTLGGSHDIGVEEDVAQKLVDYDNDGILDIVYYKAGTSGTAGGNTVVVFINEGTNESPNYQKKLTFARPANQFVEPIEDVVVKDFDNDGKADILVVGKSSVTSGTKSGSYVLLKGGESSLTAASNVVTNGPLSPISVFDKNGDGYLDICGSGSDSGVNCQLNKADGTIASFNAGSTHKGKCATGKYGAVAMKENTALVQLNNNGTCTENLYDLELAVNQQHTATLSPPLTAPVNDAKWIDIDNDGDEELAVLTNNELQVYTFTRTSAATYPQTLSQVNVNTSSSVASVISSHATESLAVAACDADSECVGVQQVLSGSWEAIKGELAYVKASSVQSVSSCKADTSPHYYLPVSCSDTSVAETTKYQCLTKYDLPQFNGMIKYFAGAELEKVEPTSLDQVPAACQFDSEADVKDAAKLETCFETENNFYAKACEENSQCDAFVVRWVGDTYTLNKDNGWKQIGTKYVPITTNTKRGDEVSKKEHINGCYSGSIYVFYDSSIHYYITESSGVTPKFKPKVMTKTITAATGTKVNAYTTCDICDTEMNQIVVADIRKTGTPQLLLSKDSSTSTAIVVTIDSSNIAGSNDIVSLKTVVPSVSSVKLGQMTPSTFESPVQKSPGLTVNAVPSQTDTTLSSTTVKLPTSCAVNFRAVNGVCEACPTGSTSSGVTSPADTPNTGCTRTDNTCLVDEYVKDNQCLKCVAPETNVAGDDASGDDTICDCVNSYGPCEGGIQAYTGTCEGGASIACSSTGASTCAGAWTECDANGDKTWYNTVVPSNGDFSSCTHESGYTVGCVCNGAQYVENGLCKDCPTGATANLVDYDPSNGDTVCLCQGAMQSDGKVCSPCPTGKTNTLVNYNPKSGVSECYSTYCKENEHVVDHDCVKCPDNSQRLAGDDPAGPDTKCSCRVNSKVIDGKCLACETGSTNPKLCYAGKEGGDTYCTCNENYFASSSNICTSCPQNSKNEAGDYAGDGPTYCNCKENFHVSNGACVVCDPNNSFNGAGDELDGGDTFCMCKDNFYSLNGVCTSCGENEYNDNPTRSNVPGKCKCKAGFKVVSGACVQCELTSTRQAGSLMSGPDTYCVCGENEKVQSNLCVDCEEGGYNSAGDDASGADTECSCKTNYQKINGVCGKCPDGTISNMNTNNECVCKVGFYVQTPGSCVLCPEGSTSTGYNPPSVVSTCKLEPGYYVDSNGDVQICPDGSTSSGGELINGGETKCKTTDGHFVDTNGNVQDCPANSAVAGGVVVESRATISGCICNKGYQAVGAACGQCPEGQTTDGTHRTDEAQRGCHCKEGYFVDPTNAVKCQKCSEGGSTAEGGDPNGAATSCDCAANYRVDANAECAACNPGETNAPLDKTQNGETQCDITYCAANERVESNVCVPCPAGMINDANDPANDINTICDYLGDTEDQFEFDVSGSTYLVQKKDGTNLGTNPTIQLRISEGPFTFSRQPASTAGDDLIIATSVVWTTQDTDYASYTQLSSYEAKDDVSVIVWVPNVPGTFYYLSKDTSTMVGKIEVSLPLCDISTSGTVILANSCILSDEIVLTGDLEIVVLPARRRALRKQLKSTNLLIQAASNKRHFSVPAGKSLTVKGMTLTDGNPGDAGGSILASGGSVVVEDVVFKDNVGTTGGAIESEKDQANNEPSVSVKGSTFENNEGSNGGGAINAKAGTFIVEGSTFKNNKATSGDGGAVASLTDMTVKTSTFELNTAPSGTGGALVIEGKLLTMEGTTLKSNSAQSGGAVGFKGGKGDLKTNVIESNTASVDGGAILIDSADVNITSSNIKSNNGGKGGGIKTKNMGGKKVNAESNTFSDNVGSDGGGAFHFEDEANFDITIFESTFLNNKGSANEADDMKSTGSSNIVVKVVDSLSEIVRRGLPLPDCDNINCNHRSKSKGKAKGDGSCRCACDGTNEYEKNSVCTLITTCKPGDVTVVNATDSSDRICGSPTIAQKQAEFDQAGAALSSLVTNKLKEAGLDDSDAFNLAVDMVGGVNKC